MLVNGGDCRQGRIRCGLAGLDGINQLAAQAQLLVAGKVLQGEIENLRVERRAGLELRPFHTSRMLLQNVADGFTGCIERVTAEENLSGNLEQTLGENQALQEAIEGFGGETGLRHQALPRKPLHPAARYAQENLLFRGSGSQSLQPLHGLYFAQPLKRVRVQHPAATDGSRRRVLPQYEGIARSEQDGALELDAQQPALTSFEPAAAIDQYLGYRVGGEGVEVDQGSVFQRRSPGQQPGFDIDRSDRDERLRQCESLASD